MAREASRSSSPSAGTTVQAADGLIAHWALNEGSGTFAADAASGYAATLAVGATWTTGRLGAGVQLDGTGGYIAPPVIDIPGSALTLAAWVNVAGYSSDVDQRIISKSAGLTEEDHYWMLSHASVEGRNLLRFRLKAGGTTTTLLATSGDLPTNTWFHAAATYDGTTMRLFLNGVEVGQTAKSGAIGASAVVPVDIGRNPDGSNHLNGIIDEVRIYGRALAASEVAAVMTDPGEPEADTTAPAISAVAASDITSSEASVTWTTNEPATSGVEYGISTTYGSAVSAPEFRTSHALRITGLLPATTYHYRAVSADAAGNIGRSADLTFATAAGPDGGGAAPIARWNFDEGSGTTSADAAGGQTATLSGGAIWAKGRSGYGVGLNGSTAYVSVPPLDVAGSRMTIAAWVNNSAFPANSDQRIISKASGSAEQTHYWMLSQTNAGKFERLRFRLKTGSVTKTLVASTGDLSPNTWYHAAATYDGATMRLYLNGVQVGSTSKTGAIAANASVPVNIGRNPDGTNHLTGTIDDVRIYNRALTGAEIASVVGGVPPPNQPPSIQVSSPVAGATFTAPATVAITATATDPENHLTDVRFYNGTTLLGTDTTAPYSWTWSSVAAGSYSITAVARDSDGGSTTSAAVGITVNPPPNQPPTVALTAPVTGATFTAPATVAITATAADPENRLADVRFYNGTTLLATDTTAPYSFTWSPVPAGYYSITAVARDSDGASTTSSAVAITVNAPANQLPTVALTAPTAGAAFTAPATIAIAASAADPENRLADVRFFAGTTLLSTDTTAPYSFTWSPVAAGSYLLTAVARDADGGSTTSAAVAVTVAQPVNLPPTVALTSPLAAATFTAPATVAIAATAADPENRLADVRFYAGTTLLATDTTAPYSFTWSPVAAGSYSITAVARDSDGASTTSLAVGISVTPSPTDPSGALAHWRFDEASGTTAVDSISGASATLSGGALWTPGRTGSAIALNGSTAYVSAPIIDVAGSGMTLAAWVNNSSFPANSDQRIISKATGSAEQAHYWMLSETNVGGARRLRFRLKTGTVTTTLVAGTGDLQPNTWYHAAATYDGGAMRLYLDGVEVGSASKTGAIATNASVPVTIGRNPEGSNHLDGAIDDLRIYNRALSSADLAAVMGAQSPTTLPPTVQLTSPLPGATFTAPATVTISASASDPENRLADVRFYAGTTLLGTDATAPYSFTWSSAGAGSYSITAVARDSDGGVTTSSPVAITINSPLNLPPAVTLTAPVNGASYIAPATVSLTATASDPENRLADVSFYAGTVLLATDTTAPYSFTWSSVPAGSYWITAVARDSDGGTASSFASAITVTGVAGTPWRVAFTASVDHDTNVSSYLVEVFASGADPNTATPIASSDLGKPALDSLREVIVDRTSFFEALAVGNYVMTVRAIGTGGSTRSAPYTFTR